MVKEHSLTSFFDNFIKSGIIIKTRKVGKSDYYKLNLDNPFVMNLIKLDWSLTKRSVLAEPVKVSWFYLPLERKAERVFKIISISTSPKF